jgi:uncharacterized membrane protein
MPGATQISRRCGTALAAHTAVRRARTLFLAVRESFWLIPGVGLLLAVLLGVAAVEAEGLVHADLAGRWPRLFGAGAEGARGTLSAIASSMITVAGVVFSVTIVALSLAANAYSPRVLRTFMHDRTTQAAFGVFVGIFAYCLVVLRTIRAADDDGAAFVPSLAVFGALVLALVGVWVLVYFIHHVAVTIQVSSILERIAGETRKSIGALFPESLGEGEDDAPAEAPVAEREWHALPARRSGYIQSVDAASLLAFARERGALLRMELGVGDFALESRPLASLSAATHEADADALDSIYALGAERSIYQDAAFGLRQIADVAVRALSPGVNDPSTAAMCADHLAALLVCLARRRMPERLRTEGGELRVIACAPSFEGLAAVAFEPLLRHARGEPQVLAALERGARAVAAAAPPRRASVIRGYLEAIEAQRA